MTAAEEKQRIRELVWRLLVDRGYARPPYPVRGRIPNFVGAEEAAARIISSREFAGARTVKVSPDSPQRPVREACIRLGKTLVVPSPRIRRGFYIIEPYVIDEKRSYEASTIRGLFMFGRPLEPESLGGIDLVVVGSVAVSPRGSRVGKGEGYSEIEYAILRMLAKIREETPIATTIHQAQIVGSIPMEPFDVAVDLIATPLEVIRAEDRPPRPSGIIWELLDSRKVGEIPLLRRLSRR